MNFTIEKINFNFRYEAADDEMMGSACMTVSEKTMREFFEDNSIDIGDEDEQIDFIEFDQDQLQEYLDNGAVGSFDAWNADLQICLFYFMLYEGSEDSYDIDYAGENPFWVAHDICHAKNDCVSYDIYVDASIEEQRIFDGIELAAKSGLLQHVNIELFHDLEEGFKQRWNYNFNTNYAIETLNRLNDEKSN